MSPPPESSRNPLPELITGLCTRHTGDSRDTPVPAEQNTMINARGVGRR